MNAEAFVDTNFFLYAIADDAANAAKKLRAQELLLTERWCWSVQVAAEFFVNATSMKRPFRLPPADAAAYVEAWLKYPTASTTSALVRTAISVHNRYQVSYWNAAIIAAAKQMGCLLIYSEDLSDGQLYGGVAVVNPFVAS